MRSLSFVLLFLCISVTSAQGVSEFFDKSDTFFKTHVSQGLVDYKAIAADPSALEELLLLAKNSRVSPKEKETYQAFWINAYNLAVIKGIIDHYPIDSPLKVNGFFDAISYELGGKKVTLNTIENTLLRAEFVEEARFHFVLVCAGLGCPPIIDQAYRPQTLDTQLERQTTLAINDVNFIRPKGKRVAISQIFEWYKEDFVRNATVVDFINRYRKNKLPETIKVSYYPYDWTLNQQN